MAVSLMRNGLSAEKSIFGQKPNVKVPRSRFDLGRLNVFTSDIGMIVPVDIIPTLPNSDYNISFQYKIDFRPMRVPTFTSYKVKLHAYYCPNEYLWSGWETFITKGRSGNLSLTVPQIKLSQLYYKGSSGSETVKFEGLTDENFKTTDGTYYPYSPMSLIAYMNGSPAYDSDLAETGDSAVPDHYLPYCDSANTLKSTGFRTVDTSALPYLMYQKIYRSNYCDPNLFANSVVKSDVWFPEDIDSSHWRLDYAASNLFGDYNQLFVPQNVEQPTGALITNFVPRPNPVSASETQDGDNAINLTQLRYSMYTDDMFTTALPFLQRGTPEVLNVSSNLNFLLDFSLQNSNPSVSSGGTAFFGVDDMEGSAPGSIPVNSYEYSGSGFSKLGVSNFSVYSPNGLSPAVRYALLGTKADGSGNYGVNIGFTAQQLRSLIALSVWQERNALTNGSYGQFIKVHFDSYPKNQFCEPIYIGGTTSVFDINSIVQTSETTSTSPQGNPSGVGGSSNSQSIGSFRADDFGFIMVLMTIIPDTQYVQQNEHWMFDKLPDDFYMPEYEQLSYQPIPNKMLVATGDTNPDNGDDGLFGYSNRYVYLKQRDSIVRGRFALPVDVDEYYHNYAQARIFTDSPKLSQQFVTVYPPNIDRSFLNATGEPAFLVQFFSNVSGVLPLSYVSQPNTFGF